MTEDNPYPGMTPAEQGVAAGEAAVAELDAEGEQEFADIDNVAGQGLEYGAEPADDETKDCPLHAETDENEAEKPVADNSSEAGLLASGEALLASGDYDGAAGLINERAILHDVDMDHNYRSGDTIISLMKEQGLTLKGNQIWQNNKHVGNAKITTSRNPVTDTVSITSIEVTHV